jgi:hypothetical protein
MGVLAGLRAGNRGFLWFGHNFVFSIVWFPRGLWKLFKRRNDFLGEVFLALEGAGNWEKLRKLKWAG